MRPRLPVAVALALSALLGGAPAGFAATSTLPNPVWTFPNPGNFNVSLSACNFRGECGVTSQTVTVLDPQPAITLATSDGLGSVIGGVALSVRAGQLVHLIGNGTGKPPLAFSWQIIQTVVLAPPVANIPAAEGWWDTTGITPGIYSAVLSLSNAFGAVDTHLSVIAITVLPAEALDFYTLTPCRIFDSRVSGGALVSGQAITIPAGTCGVPANARALAANVTVVGPTAPGKLNLYPGNYPVPPTAETSFPAGVTRATEVVVGLSSAGAQTLKARAEMSGGGSLHVIVDVNGYFAPPTP